MPSVRLPEPGTPFRGAFRCAARCPNPPGVQENRNHAAIFTFWESHLRDAVERRPKRQLTLELTSNKIMRHYATNRTKLVCNKWCAQGDDLRSFLANLVSSLPRMGLATGVRFVPFYSLKSALVR